jgi:UDP-3-O-[3-hydroxymyristoyl] glucosamine N-acyltransferase
VQLTARDIARIVDGELAGNPDEVVTGVAGIKEALPGDCTFVANAKYVAALRTTQASVVLVDRKCPANSKRTLVRVDNPSLAFGKVVEQAAPPAIQFKPGVHPSASVAAGTRLGKDVSIQPFVVIENGAVIGDRTIIGAGSYIGHESKVGKECQIYPRVTVRDRTRLGDRVILHSGAVLGADGFGYNTVEGKHTKIPQVGTVEIGDDVEIGANTTVDRGRFGKTRIGRGTKIDNLVQIGHNCVVGEDCIICAFVGVAGSVLIGNHVTIAGQVGIAGHLTIGDKAVIMAQAGVTKDVPAGAMMLGAPAVPHTEFKRVNASIQHLPEMVTKLRELEQLIADLRARLDTRK